MSLSRRRFIQVSALATGGLAVGVALGPEALAGAGEGEVLVPNAWIRIEAGGRMVFFLDRAEMGQGVATSLPMILAEELEVEPEQLVVEMAPADRRYVNRSMGMQITGGSSSVAASYEQLRAAGAVARQMLITAAARRWSVPESECRAASGFVLHDASDRREAYAALAASAAGLHVPEPRLKDPKDFKLIGQPRPRLDNLPKVTGRAVYGIDVSVPEARVAVIVRCPTFGGKVAKFDAAPARAVAGVEDVVEISSGVAVVAKRYWQARKAATDLVVEWNAGPGASMTTASVFADYSQRAVKALERAQSSKGMRAALEGGGKTLAATYEVPFMAHAAMEPGNCTAHVTADGCDIWAPTQSAGLAQQLAVELTGLPHAKVRVHTTMLGGGFGRRIYQDFVGEAVELSMKLGKPVKVMWSREDDTRHDFYRPATVHHLKAALTKDGSGVAAWAHGLSGQSILAGCLPSWLRTMAPEWLPEGLKRVAGRGARAAIGVIGGDPTSAEGAADLAYAVDSLAVEYEASEVGPPIGFWRSVGHSYTGFVVESFIDELAHAAGADPVAFRRKLLVDKPRHLATLELAAAKAGWSEPPPKGVYRGVAQHASFGSYAAQVAEVEVVGDQIRVKRVVCAVDCGRVINPDLVTAQIESGIVFGVTAALLSEITLKDGAVEQSSFHDYPVARISDAPQIEVHLVPSEHAPSGVGEPGVPPLAPAVANAVFRATGQRLRRLPLRIS